MASRPSAVCPTIRVRSGQQGEIPWQLQGGPDGADGGHRRAQSAMPASPWPRSASTQPFISRRHPRPVSKALLSRKRHQWLAQLFGRLDIPAELVKQGTMAEGEGQGEVVCHLPGQGQRFVTFRQGLIQMAKTPQCPGRIDPCADRGVDAIEESVGPMLLGIVKAKRLLELCLGRRRTRQDRIGYCPSALQASKCSAWLRSRWARASIWPANSCAASCLALSMWKIQRPRSVENNSCGQSATRAHSSRARL